MTKSSSIIQHSLNMITYNLKKPSIWCKLLFIIILILLIASFFKKNPELEGFIDSETFEYIKWDTMR